MTQKAVGEKECACDLRIAVVLENRRAGESWRNSCHTLDWFNPRSFWSRARILEGELRRKSDDVTPEQLEAAGQMRLLEDQP